jgi:acetyl-CoA acetyltransferase
MFTAVIFGIAHKQIMAGRAEVVVAGGCETFSDLPIRHSRAIRQRLIAFPKASKKVSSCFNMIVLIALVSDYVSKGSAVIV